MVFLVRYGPVHKLRRYVALDFGGSRDLSKDPESPDRTVTFPYQEVWYKRGFIHDLMTPFGFPLFQLNPSLLLLARFSSPSDWMDLKP